MIEKLQKMLPENTAAYIERPENRRYYIFIKIKVIGLKIVNHTNIWAVFNDCTIAFIKLCREILSIS